MGGSQQALVNMLVTFDDEFSDVNVQTISRWESGKVRPSFPRQVLLIKFFGDDPYQVLGNNNFYIVGLPSSKGFERFIHKALFSFGHIQSAHPYIKDYPDYVKIRTITASIANYLNDIFTYIKKVGTNVDILRACELKEMMKHPSTFRVFYVAESVLFGHIIALRLKPVFADAVARYAISDDELRLEHCAEPGENNVLYLLTSYSGTRDTVVDSILEVAGALTKDSSCESILLKIHTDFSVKCAEYFSAEKIMRGRRCGSMEGVKDGSQRYESITYKIKSSSLLVNPLYHDLRRKFQG